MLRVAGVIAASILVIGAPIVGAVYLAHREARKTEFQRVGLLAHAVQARNATVGRQTKAAFRRLAASGGRNPCSPANIALMREIDLGSTYLQAVGHVANDRLKCSSQGDHGEGVPVGPVEFISPTGIRIRPNVRLTMLPETELLVAERDGHATVVHPDLVTDIASSPDVWVGIANLSRRVAAIRRGGFRSEWLDRVRNDGEDAYFTDGDRVVALYRIPNEDYVFYAAAPAAVLTQRAHALAWRLGPIGGLVGLLLWLMLRWQMRRSRSLPTVLKAAIEGNEICVEYQPIVDLCTRRWVGAEALVRWRRPDGSLIRPDVFIQVAEDNGLVCRLTERVLAIVAEEARPLLEQRPDFHIAINLSSVDLANRDTVQLLRERPGIAPRNISIEATERGLLKAEATRGILKEIRELGIRAAIDDFGTGYSGLSYLGTFEVDILKIDKAFVDTVGTDAVTSDVAVHIIELAKTLKLEMVAEGIERIEQATILCKLGVQYGQGWLFARSMPMSKLMMDLDAMDQAVEPVVELQ